MTYLAMEWRNLLGYWSSHHYSNYCTFRFPYLDEGNIDSDLLMASASHNFSHIFHNEMHKRASL